MQSAKSPFTTPRQLSRHHEQLNRGGLERGALPGADSRQGARGVRGSGGIVELGAEDKRIFQLGLSGGTVRREFDDGQLPLPPRRVVEFQTGHDSPREGKRARPGAATRGSPLQAAVYCDGEQQQRDEGCADGYRGHEGDAEAVGSIA